MSRVYFIQAGPVRGEGLIKIGYAKDVRRRIRNMQVGCPSGLNLIASSEFGEYAPRVESRLHRAFAVLRRPHTEWFSPHPDIYSTAYRLERFRFDPLKWEEVDRLVFPVVTHVVDEWIGFDAPEEHW